MKSIVKIQLLLLISLSWNINAQDNGLKTSKGEGIHLNKNDHLKIYQANSTNGTATCYNYLYGRLIEESEYELKVELLESAFIDCLMKEKAVFEDDFRQDIQKPIVDIPKTQIFELIQIDGNKKSRWRKAKRVLGFGLIAAAILAIPLKGKNSPLKYGLVASSGISGTVLLARSMDKRIQMDHPWNNPDYFKVPQEIKRGKDKNIEVTP